MFVRFSLEIDAKYAKNVDNLHNDLSLLPERIKTENTEKVVANLHDKNEYVLNRMLLKTSIKSWKSY